MPSVYILVLYCRGINYDMMIKMIVYIIVCRYNLFKYILYIQINNIYIIYIGLFYTYIQ